MFQLLQAALVGKSKNRRRHKVRPPAPRSCRPYVERLEDRLMLTVPGVYIDAINVASETQTAQVSVTLSSFSMQVVTVDLVLGELVAEHMATLDEDFYIQGNAPGTFGTTLMFQRLTTQVSFWIQIVNDTEYEGLEWISVRLINPVNAQLANECGPYGYDDYTADFTLDDPEDAYVAIAPFSEFLEPLDDEERFTRRFASSLSADGELPRR